MKRHQAIYVKNIDSFSVYSEVVDILVSNYGWYRRDSIGHSIPCEMIYDLDDKYLYLSENFLFSGRLKYNIVSSYYACDFINITKQNNIIHQPKFKVGDRVKIDWDNIPYERTYEETVLFHTVGNVSKITPDGICVIDHFKFNDDEYTFAIEPKHLTLVESKPKCKFKVGDKVISNKIFEYFGVKIGGGYNTEIVNITDTFILSKIQGSIISIPIDIFEGYFDLKSNPKWSVGTYVEMLENHPGYDKSDNHFWEIINYEHGWNYAYIDIRLTPDGKVFKFSVCGNSFEEIWKWHENKPEKKESSSIDFIKNFEGFKIKNPLAEVPKNNWFNEEYCTLKDVWHDKLSSGEMKLSDVIEKEREQLSGGATVGKEMEVELSEDDMDYNFTKEEYELWFGVPFDHTKCTTSNARLLERYKSMMGSSWFKSEIKELKEKWSKNRILQKPEITISKQKHIKININKPKI